MYRSRHPLHPSVEVRSAVYSKPVGGNFPFYDKERREKRRAVEVSSLPAVIRASSPSDEMNKCGTPHVYLPPGDHPARSCEDPWERGVVRENCRQGRGAFTLRRNLPAARGRISFHPHQNDFDAIFPPSASQRVVSDYQPQKRLREDHYTNVERTADEYNRMRFSPSNDRYLESATYGGKYEEGEVQASELYEEDEVPELFFSSQDEEDQSDTQQQQFLFNSFKPIHTSSVRGGGIVKKGIYTPSAPFPLFSQPFSFSNSPSNFGASHGGRSRRCGEAFSTQPASSAVYSMQHRTLERQSFHPFDRARSFTSSNSICRRGGLSNYRFLNAKGRPPLLAMPTTTSTTWRNGALGRMVKRCVFATPSSCRWVYSHRCSLNHLPLQNLLNSSQNGERLKKVVPLKEGGLPSAPCVSCELVSSLCRIAEATLGSTRISTPHPRERGLEAKNEEDDKTDHEISLLAYYIHNSYRDSLLQKDAVGNQFIQETKSEK